MYLTTQKLLLYASNFFKDIILEIYLHVSMKIIHTNVFILHGYLFQSLVGLVKAITSGSVHPIDLTVYDRGIQDLIDSMLSILPDKRPTIKDLMGRMILLPTVYTLYLDAGNDELLLLKANEFLINRDM